MTISTPAKAPRKASSPVSTTIDSTIVKDFPPYPDPAPKAKSGIRPVEELLDDLKTPVTDAAKAAVKAVAEPKKARGATNGKSYFGAAGKNLSRRDNGLNRHLMIIARTGGATEAEGRAVNPKGPEASAGFGPYIAANTGVSLVVKDGRYQVAANVSGALVPDEDERLRVWNTLGGQEYLDQTVEFIRRTYPEFALS